LGFLISPLDRLPIKTVKVWPKLAPARAAMRLFGRAMEVDLDGVTQVRLPK
jgi:hypothetical protein